MIAKTELIERVLREGGLDYFEDEELLRLLLDIARCPGDREKIVRDLLNEFGSVKGVLEARDEQLRKMNGIGDRSAAMIQMIVPFVRVWERRSMNQPDRITCANDAERYCKSLLMGLRVEQFHVICMNALGRIIGQRKISDGTLGEVNSYPRIVMETALNYNANSVIFCHNHPGGTLAPSSQDVASTIQLQKLLRGVDILVADHIIVAGNDTYSMIRHGDIDYRIK